MHTDATLLLVNVRPSKNTQSDSRNVAPCRNNPKHRRRIKPNDGGRSDGSHAKGLPVQRIGKGGGSLLISNALFRSQDIKVRQRWVKLVEEVKEQGGEVRVLSSMHESGKRLDGLGGLAVILTFPIEDLGDDADDGEDDGIDADDIGTNGQHANGIEGRPRHHEDVEI